MAKRSQRHALRYEKDKAGCIWGLISIFDFRHGRTTRKLLSDRKQGSKPALAGSACSSSMQEIPNASDNRLNIEDDEGSEVAVPDSRTSVKELMEEEMVNEQSLKNQGNGSEIDAEELNSQKSWHSRKNSRRTCRACPRPSSTHSHDLDDAGYLRSEAPCYQDSGETVLDDLDIVMEELRQIHQKNRKFVKFRQCLHNNDHKKQSDQTHPVVEEKVNAAIEVFINQRSRNNKQLGEDNKTLQSKDFMDALQTLSSNKDFILRLLQDPNSSLVKQIGSLEDAQFEEKQRPNLISESNMTEENRVPAKTDDIINNKQRTFFRRSKSQEIYPPMGNETPRPSSKIVILKPGAAGLQSPNAQINVNTRVHSQYTEKHMMQNERNTSQFSFTEIKRKLKHALGKDRHGIPPEGTRRLPSEQLKRSNSDRGNGGENLGWSSPNRDHFYTEKFAKSPLGMKRGDKVIKSKGIEAVTPTEASDFPRPGMSNIYIEAKKHLVEMLDNENQTTEVRSGQSPKSLGRILSFPEYNSSPGCSPRKNSKDGMLPSQMKEPLTDPIKGENDDRLHHVREDHVTGPSPSSQDLEIESSCSDEYPNECTKSVSTNLEVPCKNGNSLNENAASTGHASPEGDLTEEAIKTLCQEEGEIMSVPIDREIQIDGDATNAVDDGSPSHGFELSFDYLKDHPSGKDKRTLSSPPAHSSSPRKVEDPDSAVDRKERPSPISVLEPLFSEDDVSPPSTICRPVDPEIQPRKIHFEEPISSISVRDCPTVCFENEESAFEYVEAVLLGSGLSWDEFLLRWLSSDQILDPSLFDEVELFSSRSCHDQKLLFDCANEVLKSVCECYFGCNPRVSLGKHNIRPVPKGMDLINEVWEGVEWYLLRYSAPHSLEQLVKKDMEISGTWINLRLDLGHIGVEMGEIILEELVDDTILSISGDTLEYAEDVFFSAKSEI